MREQDRVRKSKGTNREHKRTRIGLDRIREKGEQRIVRMGKEEIPR